MQRRTEDSTLCGSPQAEPTADPDCERLNVTPLAEISVGNSSPRVLLAGVDTLDFGLYVEFGRDWPKIVRRLAQLKRAARGLCGKPILGGRCTVLPGGKPNYPFHFQYAEFHLWLSQKREPDGKTPNVFVSLTAEFLWRVGERAAVEKAIAALVDLAGGVVVDCRISRCDLAVDVVLSERLTDGFLRSHAVTRTRSRRLYLDGDDLQTLYVGAPDADVQLRIYDKSAEVAHSEKWWFLELWGLAVNFGVWRFEFQVRRPLLRENQINSIDDLLTKRGDLWRYLTEDWFSLRCLDDPNPTRRSTHPLWTTIQECVDLFGPVTQRLQRRRLEPSDDAGHVLKQLANKFISFSARKRIVDETEALQVLLQSLQGELRDRNFTEEAQRRAIELGITLEEAHHARAA